MKKQADLHIHTHFSDSTQSPDEVVFYAKEQSLDCIAITDHDTLDGVVPTMEVAKKHGIEVISGIEISSAINGKDVHMLGYFISPDNKEFNERLDAMQNERGTRMGQMIEKLKEFGIDNIELDEVCALASSKSVGRPHLAQVMVEKGWVKDIKTAFDKYLANDAPACVDKFYQTPQEAIDMIQQAGGVAVLAHPMVTAVDELIPQLVKGGLKGIEVYYPTHSQNIMDYYLGIAKKHNLVVTGGSDAHGDAKKHTYVGKVKIDYQVVEDLRALTKV